MGHHLDFEYCVRENGGKPCRIIRDCWFNRMDVDAYLKENFSKEDIEALETGKGPAKMASLLEMIEKAKESAGGD